MESATLQQLAGIALVLRSAGAGEERSFQQQGGEFSSCGAVGGAATVNHPGIENSKECLDLMHNLATGRVALEYLPDPAPESAGKAENARAAVFSSGGLLKDIPIQSWRQMLLNLRKRTLREPGGSRA